MSNIYTIDFETYYDKKYTLSKMTTQQYIMGAFFEVIGVSIAKNSEDPVWHSFDWHTNVGKQAYRDQLQTLDGAMVLAHNAMFDMGILAHHFNVHPAVILDTLSMAKPLHGSTVGGSLKALSQKYGIGEKGTEVINALGKSRADMVEDDTLDAYGDYCDNDVSLTRDLFKKMKPYTKPLEMRVIDKTIRMYTQPSLELDTTLLKESLSIERELKENALEVAGIPRTVVMSNNQLANVLSALGVEVPTKISSTTGKETFAFSKTDKEFVALKEHPVPLVQRLVEARLLNKSTINETRMAKFIDLSLMGPLWVPLGYCGAATTWRWSGMDGVNLQNLPSRGDNTIRRAIKAPEGHKLVVVDSANIELRVNHTLAGQEDVVQALREGRDLYKEFASILYNVPVDEVTKPQRFMGKVAHLLLGYQGGWKKFKEMARIMGTDMTDEEAEDVVNTWRNTYDKIPKLWRNAEKLIQSMLDGFPMELPTAPFITAKKGLLLTPPEHYIQYPHLQRTMDGVTYTSRRGKGTETVYLYGGKLVENLCIAAGTPVLTDSGWVNIENISTTHKVYDGVEFVNHGGLLFKGKKQCVTLDGVNMTADHEVLTDEGWQEASQLQGHNGAKIRYVDRDRAFAQYWENLGVEIPVFMREHNTKIRQGRNQGAASWRGAELRVQNQGTTIEAEDPRDEPASCIRSVAFNERPVPVTNTPSVAKLRSAWNSGLRTVAKSVRGFLERYGALLQNRTDFGSEGQQWALHAEQLPLGLIQTTEQQPARQLISGHASRSQVNRSAEVNTEVSVAPQTVYDIANAGPRQRFVVAGASGPFLVHNCQHISRNILAEQFVKISERYKVAMMVHDEFVCVVPDDEAEEALEWMVEVMSASPDWWPEIPLAAEGDIAQRYGDAK